MLFVGETHIINPRFLHHDHPTKTWTNSQGGIATRHGYRMSLEGGTPTTSIVVEEILQRLTFVTRNETTSRLQSQKKQVMSQKMFGSCVSLLSRNVYARRIIAYPNSVTL